MTTTQGTCSSDEYFDANEISFPEFCKTQYVPKIHFHIFSSSTSCYNFIIGQDILCQGFIINYAHNHATWDGLSILTTVDAHMPKTIALMVTHFICMHKFYENYAVDTLKIKQAKYDSITPQTVAEQCFHLLSQQLQHLG